MTYPFNCWSDTHKLVPFANLHISLQIVSFILQSELGDFDENIHTGNYAAEYELVSRQTQELEDKSMELHQKLRGLTPMEADTLFLKKAATLDTYGLDPSPVKVLNHTQF